MKRLLTLCLLVLAMPLSAGSPGIEPPPVATFSIVAIDPANGDLGVAVASRYFSVGSVVPWAMAGVGAVATQANVNVGYGQQAIDLLRQGLTAQQVLARLLADDTFPGKDGRQVAIVDAKGNIAAHTGETAVAWAGDRQGKAWSAQGNILAGPQVVEAMGRAFETTQGELAEKLFAALKAGDAPSLPGTHANLGILEYLPTATRTPRSTSCGLPARPIPSLTSSSGRPWRRGWSSRPFERTRSSWPGSFRLQTVHSRSWRSEENFRVAGALPRPTSLPQSLTSPESRCYTDLMATQDFFPRLDRKVFSVRPLYAESDEKGFWAQKSPLERLEALEQMRQILYGYDPATTRLQRVLTVAQREPG